MSPYSNRYNSTSVYTYMYIFVYKYVYICVYIYLHINIYVYIYTYVYTRIYVSTNSHGLSRHSGRHSYPPKFKMAIADMCHNLKVSIVNIYQRASNVSFKRMSNARKLISVYPDTGNAPCAHAHLQSATNTYRHAHTHK